MTRAVERERDPWPWIWAAVALTLLIALIAVSLGWYSTSQSNSAGDQARRTAACVNDILGNRQPLTQADAEADLAFLRALYNLSRDKPGSARAIRDTRTLVDQIAKTYHIKSADQVQRLRQPLGKC